MSINYNNSKVYKIWSPQGDKIYVGSTTKELLCQRMTSHRTNYKTWKKGNRGLTTSFLLFDEYGLENCFIELIEAKPCNSKDELLQLEGHYIRTLKCVNKCISGRTRHDYYLDNEDKIKEYRKEYQNVNKETIAMKDKIKYEQNKEIISDRYKDYYASNKEKILEYHSTIVQCICGCSIARVGLPRHQKSTKHESRLKLLKPATEQ